MRVCCNNGEMVKDQKTFKTYGQDLHEMAQRVKAEKVDLVIMESTYQVLEKMGIKSAVVNARQIKQMVGKKTYRSFGCFY